eukprot:gene31068-7162_t
MCHNHSNERYHIRNHNRNCKYNHNRYHNCKYNYNHNRNHNRNCKYNDYHNRNHNRNCKYNHNRNHIRNHDRKNITKCSATGQPLELPVVHFLCGHSFNLRSMGENERECPICTPDFKRVFDIRRNMAASAMHQDRFFTELRENADGFSVVAEHFGRGLMNMTAGATAAAREL